MVKDCRIGDPTRIASWAGLGLKFIKMFRADIRPACKCFQFLSVVKTSELIKSSMKNINCGLLTCLLSHATTHSSCAYLDSFGKFSLRAYIYTINFGGSGFKVRTIYSSGSNSDAVFIHLYCVYCYVFKAIDCGYLEYVMHFGLFSPCECSLAFQTIDLVRVNHALYSFSTFTYWRRNATTTMAIEIKNMMNTFVLGQFVVH